uniref:Uncharacterized protein n=1 Tax=Melopsittacus undulatus TaxID=13146 RepID=A0A8C6NER8_MELUD
MAEQLGSRRNFSRGLYPTEDDGSAKWKRLKRSLYQGRPCRIRGCCTGRDDDCSFNIVSRAAICYCDQFCASGSPGPVDCCADYWDSFELIHLKNNIFFTDLYVVLTGCYRAGRHYGEGAVIKDNCNSCKCLQSLWKCSKEICLVRQDLIQHINSGDYGWKAANYTQFWGMTVEEGFKKRLGTFPPSHSLLNMKEPPVNKFPIIYLCFYI